MQWTCLQKEEQQEFWNTLEVLMHGRTASEVRCAQQRLEVMETHLRPQLPPTTQNIFAKVLRAAICASHGGEHRFYWLNQVEHHWRSLLASLDRRHTVRGHDSSLV